MIWFSEVRVQRTQTLLKSSVLIVASLLFAATSLSARQAPGIAGTWKLDEAASTNPNGPAAAAPAGAGAPRGGGAGAGKRADNFDATGGAAKGQNATASELSPEEKQRIKAMLTFVNKAASVLEIVADGKDVQIKQDNSGFPKQSSDGKKSVLKNPQVGEVDIKVKIDNKGMTREISTQEDLKIVETYALSADGKQLTVTVKESHPVMKIDDPKIKRVYNKQ